MKLSREEKREANNFQTELKKNIQKFLGVEFGPPAHGKLTIYGYGTNVMRCDEWIKNVMNKKIKKEIKVETRKPNARNYWHENKEPGSEYEERKRLVVKKCSDSNRQVSNYKNKEDIMEQ